MFIVLLVIFFSELAVFTCTVWKFADESGTTALGDGMFLEVQTGPDAGYVSLHEMGVDVAEQDVKSLTFQVRAAREVRLALLQDAGETRRYVYEITLGGWGNTMSVIRKTVRNGRIFTEHRHRPLNNNEFRSFWVSWGQGRVSVGTGLVVGSHEFMTYRDPVPHQVNYISVKTSWGAIGRWKFNMPSQTVGLPTASDIHALKYHGYGIENRTSVSFLVKASADVNILLSRYAFSYGDMYWVAIGTRTNSWSFIRKGRMGPDRAHAVHRPLSVDHYMSFWVGWGNGLIRVGEGTQVGRRQFMSWKDPTQFPVQDIYVSTSDTARGHWIFNLKDEAIPLPATVGGLHLPKN